MADADTIEFRISRLLRASVLVAAAVISVGVGVLAWNGVPSPDAQPDQVATFAVDPLPAAPLGPTVKSFLIRLGRGDAAAIIQLGVVLLLLTPIARVAATMLLFLRQGDRLLAAIAGVVLLVLALSATGLVMR